MSADVPVNPDIPLSDDALWAIAKRYATEAMAEIGEMQLSRPHPTLTVRGPLSATQIIRAAIVGALREALGRDDD